MTSYKRGPVPGRYASGLSIAALILIITFKGFTLLHAQDNGWSLNGSTEPPPQSFEIKHAELGGSFSAQINIASSVEAAGKGVIRISLDDRRVTKTVVQRSDPGGGITGAVNRVSWQIVLAEIDYPYQRISKVRAVFDKGSTESQGGGSSTYDLLIPGGATRLLSFEVTFAWQENVRTLIFAGQAKPPGSGLTVSATWEHPKGRRTGFEYGIEEYPKRIAVPVRYKAKRQASLKVTATVKPKMNAPAILPNATVAITVANLVTGKQTSIRRQGIRFSSSGEAQIPIDVDSTLKALDARINLNALEARVAVVADRKWGQADTDNLLHILRQKLILFIPGVCGSEITVRAHPGYPAFLDESLGVVPESFG